MTNEEYHKHDETNLLIAEFMGMETSVRHPRTQEWTKARFDFHNSWNELMSVVEKIESLFDGMGQSVIIENRTARMVYNTQYDIAFPNALPDKDFYTGFASSKIKAAYILVVAFIQWYNENKQQ